LLTQLLGRRAGEASPVALSLFLGRQAAFVAQKTVLDYCRVKAGQHERQLFTDPDFIAALRHCRWEVFLAALADVTALAEAWLRPLAAQRPGGPAALADGLVLVHAAALDAASPPAEKADAAFAAKTSIAGHLADLQLREAYPANRLPLRSEAPLFATLPIHPDQRRGESPAIRGALRFHIVTTQQEMERRFDRAGLAAAVATPRSPEAESPEA
jgi:hypothetical protein